MRCIPIWWQYRVVRLWMNCNISCCCSLFCFAVDEVDAFESLEVLPPLLKAGGIELKHRWSSSIKTLDLSHSHSVSSSSSLSGVCLFPFENSLSPWKGAEEVFWSEGRLLSWDLRVCELGSFEGSFILSILFLFRAVPDSCIGREASICASWPKRRDLDLVRTPPAAFVSLLTFCLLL